MKRIPHIFQAKLISKTYLAKKFILFKFAAKERFDFAAGQYVSIKVSDDGIRRPYSVACLPGGKEIDLLVDISPNGVGTRFLLSLEMGESVKMLGPVGRFALSESLNRESELFFVGTGSGIAPLKSIIEDLLVNKRTKNKIKLLWGLRHESHIFWKKEFDDLVKKYDNFDYEICLSAPEEKWQGKRGRVTGWVEKMQLTGREKFYLCGSSEMVGDVSHILAEKGVGKEKIYWEKFS